MTRGKIYYIDKSDRLYASVEFNGDMYPNGNADEILERFDCGCFETYGDYRSFVERFNKRHYGYEEELIVSVSVEKDKVICVTDNWTDYLYIINGSEHEWVIKDSNGTAFLDKGSLAIVHYQQLKEIKRRVLHTAVGKNTSEPGYSIPKEYENSVDQDVLDFVNGVIDDRTQLKYVTVAFLSERASEDIKNLTGKETKGNRIVLDTNAVKHIVNRHGVNGKQDNSMQSAEDIARMGYILMNYDGISFQGQTTPGYSDENGEPAPLVQFQKKINGTYYIVETVNSSKGKRNYVVTAYISRK